MLHQCHLLISTMVHFITQLQYYVTFEVYTAIVVIICLYVREREREREREKGERERYYCFVAGDGVLLG